MMKVPRRLKSAQHPGEPELAARRRQQVLAANNNVDAVPDVIDGHGELVGPLPKPVTQQQIATLALRPLLLRAE